MSKKLIYLISFVLSLGMLQAVPAVAQAAGCPLLGNDFAGRIYDVDPLTGVLSAPRGPGVASLSGISFSPDGILYGITSSLSSTSALFTIDPTSGQPQPIGQTELAQLTEGDLDFDPTTGELYGIYGGDIPPLKLFKLNTSTGIAAIVGMLPFPPLVDPSAMAFDEGGDLYVFDNTADVLVRVNQNTGAMLSSVPVTPALPASTLAGMDFDPFTGKLYVATGFAVGGANALYTLDPNTGVLTQVGPLSNGLAGLEFVPACNIAYNPSPPDGATCVPLDVVLSWSPGCCADSHDVYFGDNFDDVDNADTTTPGVYNGRQAGGNETYTPGPLKICTTYYWRIDEVCEYTIFTVPPDPAHLLAYYEFEGDTSDSSGNNLHGTPIGDATIVADVVRGQVLSLDGNGDYVDLGNDPLFNPTSSGFSISVWFNMSSWGNNWGNVIVSKRGESGVGWQLRRHGSSHRLTFTTRGIGNDDPQGTIEPSLNEWHHIAAIYDGSKKVVYLDCEKDIEVAASGTINASDHKVYIGARANDDNTGPDASSFFNGMIDDVRIYNYALSHGEARYLGDCLDLYKRETWKGNVWEFTTCCPPNIKWSQPPDEIPVYVGWDEESHDLLPRMVADDFLCDSNKPVTAIRWWGSFLGWRERTVPPEDELPYGFYITIWDDVPDPDPNDPNYYSHPGQIIWENYCYNYDVKFCGWEYDPRIGKIDLTKFEFYQEFDPNDYWYQPDNNQIHWLGIMAIYDDGSASYRLVDDFESYTDTPDLLDAWQTLGAANLFLSEDPNPYHWGDQAMGFIYDNNTSPYYSESAFTPAEQNWTSGGVRTLGLWFKGAAYNDPEPMYVGVSDNINIAVVPYDGNADDVKREEWQLWCIDLSKFTGVNLANVRKLFIGFGDRDNPQPGGSGTIYVDDIRLYEECLSEPNFLWGWETRKHVFQDDAVRFFDYPQPNQTYDANAFEPIEFDRNSWDLSFELLTEPSEPPYVPLPILGDINGNGYVDFPDLTILAGNWLECNKPDDPDCTWGP